MRLIKPQFRSFSQHFHHIKFRSRMNNNPSLVFIPQRTASIFISYAHNSQEESKIQVKDLAYHLKASGHDPILDIHDFRKNIIDSMTNGMVKCDIFMPVLTNAYNESYACNQEMNAAWDQQKAFVPLVGESEYKPSPNIKMMMNTKLYIEIFDKPIDEYGERILTEIKSISDDKYVPFNKLSNTELLKFAYFGTDNKLILHNAGKESHCVLSIIGASDIGKSTFANCMMQYNGYRSSFLVRSNPSDAKTIGIDMVIFRNEFDQIITIRDCQGLTHVLEHKQQINLLTISYFTSDVLIWNVDIKSLHSREFGELITSFLDNDSLYDNTIIPKHLEKPLLFVLIRDEGGFYCLPQDYVKENSPLKKCTLLFSDIITLTLPQPSVDDVRSIRENIFMDKYKSTFKEKCVENMIEITEKLNNRVNSSSQVPIINWLDEYQTKLTEGLGMRYNQTYDDDDEPDIHPNNNKNYPDPPVMIVKTVTSSE
eukprot:17136_1